MRNLLKPFEVSGTPFVNKKYHLSISSRIAILFSATFALGLFAASVITYFQIESSLEKSNREVIFSKTRELSTLLSTDGVKGLRLFLSEEKNRIVDAPSSRM